MFQKVFQENKYIRMNVQNVLQHLQISKESMCVSNALQEIAMNSTLNFIIKKVNIQLFLTLKRFQKIKMELFRLQNWLLGNLEEQIQTLIILKQQFMYFVINAIKIWTILSLKYLQWLIQFYWHNLHMNNPRFKNGSLNYNLANIHFYLIKLEHKKQQIKGQLTVKNAI